MTATTGRSIWKGTITFSLVSIPVALYPVTSDTDKTRMHMYRASDNSPIRQRLVAEVDGDEVARADTVKGIDAGAGTIVVLTADELATIKLPSLKEIAVEHVTSEAEIDPLLLSGKNYYVAPDKAGVRAYALLRDALHNAGLAGVVKVTLRSRETVGLLVARDGILVLELLNWAEDIRKPVFPVLDREPEISEAECDMAQQLISAMEGKFDPGEFSDGYEAALTELVEAKRTGADLPTAPEAPAASTNLADALAASLKATPKASKAGGKAKAKK